MAGSVFYFFYFSPPRMMQELIDVQKAHQQLLSLVLQEKKISLSQLQ